MKKVKDVLVTLFKATKYSFGYTWRNAKFGTAINISMQGLIAVAGFLIVYATGIVINGVQRLMNAGIGVGLSPLELLSGELRKPFLFFAGALIFALIVNRLDWFYYGRWSHWLRHATKLELNKHKASLDVAMFRSKRYDDLRRKIEELPYSWSSHVNFARELVQIFSTCVSFLLFGATLFYQKWEYALVIIITSIPLIVMEFRQTNLWWKVYEDMVPNNKRRGMLERIYTSIVSFTQALMFHQTKEVNKEIRASYLEDFNLWDKARKTGVKREFITHLISLAGLYFVVVHAVWSTLSLSIAIGTLTILIAAARTMQANVESIVNMVSNQWNTAKGVVLIEEEFFGLKPIIQTPHPVLPNFTSAPLIKFDKVSFIYPDQGDKEVLKNVSFEIKPGEIVAIVGKSGHGKSTIASLLMRHYDPTKGDIFANDINLKNISPDVWSKYAAALTQKYSIIERKVGEEIASSNLDQILDMQRVKESAEFGVFSEVIAKDKEGFETQIGTDFGGREFSGGEEQRLALARLHHRATPIIILDEPDAKLDPENAETVIKNILALKERGITVVLITHHVSRAERCDHIIVMSHGEVAEHGSHTELLARKALYASMFEKDKARLGVTDWSETEKDPE